MGTVLWVKKVGYNDFGASFWPDKKLGKSRHKKGLPASASQVSAINIISGCFSYGEKLLKWYSARERA